MSSPSVLRKKYAEAERFVRSGIKGQTGHDSTQEPFMLPALESVDETGSEKALVDALLPQCPHLEVLNLSEQWGWGSLGIGPEGARTLAEAWRAGATPALQHLNLP